MARRALIAYAVLSGLLASIACHGAYASGTVTPPASGAAPGNNGALMELPLPPAPVSGTPAAIAPQTVPTPPVMTPSAVPTISPPALSMPAAPAVPPAPAVAMPPIPAATTASPVAKPTQSPSAPLSLGGTPGGPVTPAAPPAMPAPNSLSKSDQDLLSKNPDLLVVPTHLDNVSLMFNKSDLDVISQALLVYDRSHTAKVETTENKDSLTSLLDSLKSSQTSQPTEAPQALPNLYLGSIVYYSPSHWSIWINGKKLMNPTNQASNELYVAQISASQIELVWKPAALLDTAQTWRDLTESGAKPLANIRVDEQTGKIILRMHTNQTFLPKSLAIREGLVLSAPVTASNSTLAPASPAPDPQDKFGKGLMLKKGFPGRN